MGYKFICIGTLIFFWVYTGICQNVGIQIPNPESTLDINGNLSLRSTDLVIGEGNHLALDVNSNPFSNYRISGPTAPFSISGFSYPNDGRVLYLLNNSNQSMTIFNEDANALPSEQIVTGTGNNIIIPHNGSLQLMYDGLLQKWMVKNTSNENGGNSNQWIDSGNDISNGNSGNVGIGTNTPIAKLEVQSLSSYTVPNFTIKELNPIEFARLQMYNASSDNFWQLGALNNNGLVADERFLIHNSRFGNVVTLSGDGNVGLGLNHLFPLASLDVLRGTAPWGTAVFRGSETFSYFNYGDGEQTYIRAGKYGSFVKINDNHNGDVFLASGGGNVNVGSNNFPAATLDVSNKVNKNTAIFRGVEANSVFNSGIFNGNTYIRGGYFNSNIITADQGTMKLGVGNSDPTATLSVGRKDSPDGTAVFWGTSHGSHFNYSLDEDTYIRGGKDNSKVLINDTHGGNVLMANGGGNVGIGIANPFERLAVNGTIRSKEIVVETNNWPDYVFDQNYKRMNLYEVEAFIIENKHLPKVPCAKELESSGLHLGEMQKKMMEKIEELTLYIIELKREIDFIKTKQR